MILYSLKCMTNSRASREMRSRQSISEHTHHFQYLHSFQTYRQTRLQRTTMLDNFIFSANWLLPTCPCLESPKMTLAIDVTIPGRNDAITWQRSRTSWLMGSASTASPANASVEHQQRASTHFMASNRSERDESNVASCRATDTACPNDGAFSKVYRDCLTLYIDHATCSQCL